MPHISTRSTTTSMANDVADRDASRAWGALRRHLQMRSRELNDEVAHYPQPIARCDVQLSKLLEQRGRVYRMLERAGAIGDAPQVGERRAWIQAVDQFVRNPEPDCDDDGEIALRAYLADALTALRGGDRH